jgi:hypothetical protein
LKEKTQKQLMSQLGPIQNHSNQATRVACDIDKTAQPPVVERSLFFSRVLYLSIMETIKNLIENKKNLKSLKALLKYENNDKNERNRA